MKKVKADLGAKQTIHYQFGLEKDGTAVIVPEKPIKIFTSAEPPANPKAGDQWMSPMGLTFCWCPPGSYKMGIADRADDTRDAEEVDVTISNGFWISKYELTNRDYYYFRRHDVRSRYNTGNLPLNSLNGPGAIGFAKKIVSYMKKAKLSTPKGLVYRLPTEAEWEYACLAGSSKKYSFGDDENDLYKYANFADASLKADDGTFYYAAKADDGVGRLPAPVGSYLPNAWGIHDMHGNVSEYCKDLYVPKLPGGTDPLINIDKGNIVFRGGGWCSTASYCRAGFRQHHYLSHNDRGRPFLGLRIVLGKDIKASKKAKK